MPVLGALSNRSATGIRNARVFPVPVCAVASRSLPLNAEGIALACTGVGVWKLLVESCSWRYFEIGSSENCWINMVTFFRYWIEGGHGRHGILDKRRRFGRLHR